MLHIILQTIKVLFVMTLAVLVVAVAHAVLVHFAGASAAPTRTIALVVSPNESSTQLASDLQAKGLIRSATLFRADLLVKRTGNTVMPGRYVLRTGMTIPQIIDALSHTLPSTPAP